MNGKSLSNHARLLQVILAPQVSEKATFVGEKHNQVIFRVVKNATKPEIKAAVELLWRDQKIEVAKVRTLNVKGKKRRFGKFMGKRNNWKKAFVSVKNGLDINFTELSKGDAK